MLDAHRVPFQLMRGKPENIGSMGDIEKVARVFVRNELTPLQKRFKEIKDWLGVEVIRFKDYSLESESPPQKCSLQAAASLSVSDAPHVT